MLLVQLMLLVLLVLLDQWHWHWHCWWCMLVTILFILQYGSDCTLLLASETGLTVVLVAPTAYLERSRTKRNAQAMRH